jgi:hypothetical protein
LSDSPRPRVLHIVSDSVVSPRERYLGSTKDARGRTEYFASRGIHADELVVEGRSDSALRDHLQATDLSLYAAVLCELAVYPLSIQYLHQHPARPRLFVRPINAEFFHRLHHAWAENRAGCVRDLSAWSRLRGAFYRLRLDLFCARRADCILSMTDWETESYWKRFADPARVRTVPYFLPREFMEGDVPAAAKAKRCVCLLSSKSNPLLHDALVRFERCVSSLGKSESEWEFVVTGDVPLRTGGLSSRVHFLGLLESPYSVLREARAVAVLSDFGFGFKTKILDAIQHKCFVLVTKRLFHRLPAEVRPFCRLVDTHSPTSFQKALELCMEPYPDGDPNMVLRDQAYRALDACLGLAAGSAVGLRIAS